MVFNNNVEFKGQNVKKFASGRAGGGSSPSRTHPLGGLRRLGRKRPFLIQYSPPFLYSCIRPRLLGTTGEHFLTPSPAIASPFPGSGLYLRWLLFVEIFSLLLADETTPVQQFVGQITTKITRYTLFLYTLHILMKQTYATIFFFACCWL